MLLRKCKGHGGPVTTGREVNDLTKRYEGQEAEVKQILRQKIQYQRVTHRKDAVARAELYNVNKLTKEIMRDNLINLVS